MHVTLVVHPADWDTDFAALAKTLATHSFFGPVEEYAVRYHAHTPRGKVYAVRDTEASMLDKLDPAGFVTPQAIRDAHADQWPEPEPCEDLYPFG